MIGAVFDIECDGLDPTKIHCLSVFDGNRKETTTDVEVMRDFFENTPIIVGHNIARFDLEVVRKLLGVTYKGKVIDTLALSWYLEPDRIKHGLEGYGEDFGVPKPVIEDWDNQSIEDYMHRCAEDVKINTMLWERQWKQLLRMYGTEEEALRLVAYLSFKMACAAEQERNGWQLDIPKCQGLIAELGKEKEQKLAELVNGMPKIAISVRKSRPAKPFKKNGEWSKTGEEWFTLLKERGMPETFAGEIEVIKDWKEPNPGSHQQIKEWLFSLGWKPTTFQYKRDKTTNDVKKIPQIQQDKTLGPGLCQSVKKLYDKEPKLEVLDGLSILTHRLAILEGFINNVDGKGMLKAEIGGLTNTLRFKHRILVNLPGVQTLYGKDIRGCLVAGEGYELCGSDASGLEDRLKQHYIWPYDPEYVKQLMSPDYDPHLQLALDARGITQEQFDDYKAAEVKDPAVKAIRHTFKQGNYACQYMAGGPRVALTCGISTYEGNKLVEVYWRKNWAIKKAAEDQIVSVFYGSKWLFNPVSRFWYSLRCDKDRFSTLVQGTGVYAFDTWLRHVRSTGLPIIGQFHDEFVARLRAGQRDRCDKTVAWAMERTNEELKLNRELGCDTQYGNTYADIH